MPERRRLRGVTPRPRSGAAAERARLQRRRNGREELPRVRGQGRQLGGPIPRLRPEAAAGRSNPTSKEWWVRRRRRAQRSYSMFKVKGRGSEEIPLIQGKEQRLRYAGAAVKRYPKPKVRETQVRR